MVICVFNLCVVSLRDDPQEYNNGWLTFSVPSMSSAGVIGCCWHGFCPPLRRSISCDISCSKAVFNFLVISFQFIHVNLNAGKLTRVCIAGVKRHLRILHLANSCCERSRHSPAIFESLPILLEILAPVPSLPSGQCRSILRSRYQKSRHLPAPYPHERCPISIDSRCQETRHL